ncbi:hypothetical protein MJO28_010662 [Puccinia striiformis f. sp. tritici]|uniref:Uncharacterized protein n=1 Tax=Puccinia striiformis f. sp. tritici TaxID=168172 RepID=A0ACC0E5R4_9BASI|nr:hypothetical protein MJO28_010662 [Puccinia striiformis f. sp. tritici]
MNADINPQPFFRARPNKSPLALSRMRAESGPRDDGTSGSLDVSVTMVGPYQFDVIPGRPYEFAGKVGKLDNGITTIFNLDYSPENRLLPGGEEVELARLVMSGLGRITRV